MSTSERVVDTRLLKQLTLVSAAVPVALLAWDAWPGQLGVNAVNFVIRTTGLVGLVSIVPSLLVTPVRQLTGWSRASVSSTVHEIATRRYLWFGLARWC